jgi:hypothetical protein
MSGVARVAVSRYHIAAKALNSIELDRLPLITRDVTPLHLRGRFGNAGERRMLIAKVVERVRLEIGTTEGSYFKEKLSSRQELSQ